jgi:DNA repair protein RAD7
LATKKRKLTKTAQEKAKETAKKKGKKGDGGDDGSDDEEDPYTYTALSKSGWSGAPVKPPVGNLEKCAKCE